MSFLADNCKLLSLSETNPIVGFDCGNHDLNDFFCKEALYYYKEMLGETLFFKHNSENKIVCAFTISNDSLKVDNLPSSRKNKIKARLPHEKSMKSFPAILIGRLGVSKEFSGKGIGRELLEFIKNMCVLEFNNRCRFLIVDAYNTDNVLNFYLRSNFVFIFSKEEQERKYYDVTRIKTRMMYFDLLPIRDAIKHSVSNRAVI